MISVIIPVYNQAKRLAKCLDSLLTQTYKDYEVIVINDGSKENIGMVIDKFTPLLGNKLKYIRQENKGAPMARNRGASEARGEYFLFCDADIQMTPDMLEQMLKTLADNPRASYAYASFKYGYKTFKLFPFDAGKLKQMPYIHTTSLIRAKDFVKFDEALKKFQDWDLWLTLSEQGKSGIWIDKILFKVTGGGTMSAWFPKIFFKLPLKPSWIKKEIKRYDEAKILINKKHGI